MRGVSRSPDRAAASATPNNSSARVVANARLTPAVTLDDIVAVATQSHRRHRCADAGLVAPTRQRASERQADTSRPGYIRWCTVC